MMHEWNVVVSVRDRNYKRARHLLENFGLVSRTGFYNVLVLKVDNITHMLEVLRERVATDDKTRASLAHVMPVTRSFSFQTPEEFEAKAKEAVLPWLPELAGKGFHVRIHRRGFKGRLSSQDEERMLDGFLLENLEKAGTPAYITFEDPDAILAVETVNQWAGLALWARDDLKRYPFLHLD
jgi:tRNA(Ser,Leu) C12 N-acetylase TAN1